MKQEKFEFVEETKKSMNLESSYPVVMNNDLVMGRQAMGLNEAKLLRLAIMQIVKEDTELMEYTVKLTDLADLLGISSSNLYRDIRNICESLMKEVIYIGDHLKPKKKWEMFNWVSRCGYDGEGIVSIKLHSELKPYLIGLKEWYTTYPCESALAMKSVYAIRIYEIIMAKKMLSAIPAEGTKIEVMIEEIRRACDCENKFAKISDFKKKVIDISIREINQKTECNVTYENGNKEGRKLVSLFFYVNYKFNKIRSGEELNEADKNYIYSQMEKRRDRNEKKMNELS